MSPYTAYDLSKVLKETWNEDVFKKAFDLEVQGADLDMRQQAHRQMYPGVSGNIYTTQYPSHLIGQSPQAVRERKARQNEMMQLLAAKQRKGKPSYRQRQKNGRAGRKK